MSDIEVDTFGQESRGVHTSNPVAPVDRLYRAAEASFLFLLTLLTRLLFQMSKEQPNIKAVIFDIGGVVVGSPIVGAGIYEKEHGLPYHYINAAITGRGHNGAFQKLERGEIKLGDFYREFGKELSDVESSNRAYKAYCAKTKQECPSLPTKLNIDGETLWDTMMSQAIEPDELVLTAINRLKASKKFKLAALTNNFVVPDDNPPPKRSPPPRRTPSSSSVSVDQLRSSYQQASAEVAAKGAPTETLRGLFDEFFESALIGLRKPDPKFYLYALEKLGVKPHEAVFLDDIGINLVAARKLGIHTIRVHPGKSIEAVRELEVLVGISLTDRRSKL